MAHYSGGSGGKVTYYDDLGLDSTASSKDIKAAYLDISKRYHPDVNPDNPAALEKFHRANEAHNVLSNPRLRRQYDRGRLGKMTSVADRESTTHRVRIKGGKRGIEVSTVLQVVIWKNVWSSW